MAMASTDRKYDPRFMLIHFGHNAARSMPTETLLSTMQSAIWLNRNPRPAEKVPALAAGVSDVCWMCNNSSYGFHRYCPYISAVADVTSSPQIAVTLIAMGAMKA